MFFFAQQVFGFVDDGVALGDFVINRGDGYGLRCGGGDVYIVYRAAGNVFEGKQDKQSGSRGESQRKANGTKMLHGKRNDDRADYHADALQHNQPAAGVGAAGIVYEVVDV